MPSKSAQMAVNSKFFALHWTPPLNELVYWAVKYSRTAQLMVRPASFEVSVHQEQKGSYRPVRRVCEAGCVRAPFASLAAGRIDRPLTTLQNS